MIHAGIPERVAMEVCGHRTRKTFEQYHIVSDRDIHEVGSKIEKHLSDLGTGTRTGTISGTIGHSIESKLLN
jgi:hypothetical protein